MHKRLFISSLRVKNNGSNSPNTYHVPHIHFILQAIHVGSIIICPTVQMSTLNRGGARYCDRDHVYSIVCGGNRTWVQVQVQNQCSICDQQRVSARHILPTHILVSNTRCHLCQVSNTRGVRALMLSWIQPGASLLTAPQSPDSIWGDTGSLWHKDERELEPIVKW